MQVITFVPGSETVINVTPKLLAVASCFLHAPRNVIFSSIKQLFLALRTAQEILGVPAEDIMDKTILTDNVINRSDTQYLTLIMILYPGMLKIASWIVESFDVIGLFQYANIGAHLPDGLLLNIKRFLRTVPISSCSTISKCAIMASRVEWANDLLVNPFETDTTFTGVPDHVISCEGVSIYAPPVIGDRQIVTHEVFYKRFHEFTCGMFEGQFPWENVYVAGGALKVIMNEGNLSDSSDVDIFVTGENKEVCRRTFLQVLMWFEEKMKDVVFCTVGSVTVVVCPGIPRVFQIINSCKETLAQILGDFDTSNSAWGCTGRELSVLCIPEAIISLKTRTTFFLRNSNNQEFRCVKAMIYGYNLTASTLVENAVNIEEVMGSVDPCIADMKINVWHDTKEAITEALINKYKAYA